MNEDSQQHKETGERYLVDTWDLDTVEFELSMAPWPLRWDAATRILTWASEPVFPPEYDPQEHGQEFEEGLTSLLDVIRTQILNKSLTHVRVADAIFKAFPMDDLLAEKGVRIVKRAECYLPKGYIR